MPFAYNCGERGLQVSSANTMMRGWLVRGRGYPRVAAGVLQL
jgi:hypothetical protein